MRSLRPAASTGPSGFVCIFTWPGRLLRAGSRFPALYLVSTQRPKQRRNARGRVQTLYSTHKPSRTRLTRCKQGRLTARARRNKARAGQDVSDRHLNGSYCVADFSPRRRMRSCSFLRSGAGAFGLKATRYHNGCERSRLSRESVAASLFGWRAMFSRIAEYG